MPSFLSKLFRRKSGSPVDDGDIATKLKGKKTKVSKKDKAALKNGKEQHNLSAINQCSNSSTHMAVSESIAELHSDRVIHVPASKSESPTNRDIKNGSRSSYSGVLSPRNDNARDSQSPAKKVRERDHVPLPHRPGDGAHAGGFADFRDENRENGSSAPLSYSQLQQFERQQARESVKMSKPYESAFGEDKVKLTTRLSDGQLVSNAILAACSPGSSSDFCFSTDAEDEDYNQMRERAAKNKLPHNKPTTTVSSPMEYSTDEDAQTPKNASYAVRSTYYISDADDEPDSHIHSGIAASDSFLPLPFTSHQKEVSKPEGMENRNDDSRVWTTSPTKGKKNIALSQVSIDNEADDNTASSSSPRFTFDSEVEDVLVSKNKGKTEAHKRSPSPDPRSVKTHLQGAKADRKAPSEANVEKELSEKHPLSPRTIAILQGQKIKSAVPVPFDMYPDSTDSEYEQPPEKKQPSALLPPLPKKGPFLLIGEASLSGGANSNKFEIENFADFDSAGFSTLKGGESDIFNTSQTKKIGSFKSRSFLIDTNVDSSNLIDPLLSSKSVADPTSPISDLLAQAKERRNRRLQGAAASSVNSAPVITAAYLRQHHKLGSSKSAVNNDFSVRHPLAFRSVSSGGHVETSDALSVNSGGASSAAMAAKEKLRERRKEKDDLVSSGAGPVSPKQSASTTLRKNRSRSSRAGPEDDDSEKGDNSEDWLIDEVTGALGPRGIAADLESLSGRSNRSNKSHRSHRSIRSNKPSSRRHKSSSESIDSRQSRTSRYSTRSHRSALSHMSEQSRSVANDLLRLEMQLAMVGSQAGVDDVKGGDATVGADGRSVGSGSLGVTSYNSRTSRTSRYTAASRASATMTKRTKLTVVAPPGKLGIILANKTDAKGTVVSGVRTSSVLADKISPGDRIIAIDNEDVSRMTVSEITTIMARKNEFDRVLTVLTTPKQQRDAIAGADVIWSQLSAGPRPNPSYSRHSAPDGDLTMAGESSVDRLARDENNG